MLLFDLLSDGILSLIAVGAQSTVGGDPRAVEFELEPMVDRDPQRELFGFTRRARHASLRCMELCS